MHVTQVKGFKTLSSDPGSVTAHRGLAIGPGSTVIVLTASPSDGHFERPSTINEQNEQGYGRLRCSLPTLDTPTR